MGRVEEFKGFLVVPDDVNEMVELRRLPPEEQIHELQRRAARNREETAVFAQQWIDRKVAAIGTKE